MGVPIVVFWTNFTASYSGSVFKSVKCENCPAEFVYRLEREAIGATTSLYNVDFESAQNRAVESGNDTLKQVLENDYDAIPCPRCGHYQSFMFAKLYETKSMVAPIFMAVIILFGCLATVSGIYWSITYANRPIEYSFQMMAGSWGVAIVMAIMGILLGIKNHRDRIRFDPNQGSPFERIALGQSRSMLRADFDIEGPARLLSKESAGT